MRFIFPPDLEHPESTGRLDVFAEHGPTDALGQLRGGWLGRHVHRHHEIKHMIADVTRGALYQLMAKPKDLVRSVVEGELLPRALQHCYTRDQVWPWSTRLTLFRSSTCSFAYARVVAPSPLETCSSSY